MEPRNDSGRPASPSGQQFEIRWEGHLAVITEVGASLRLYTVDGRDVVVPFKSTEISPAYHGAVLLPWPNRLGDGQYSFDGVEYQLALNEPERRTAIHGLAAWERWTLREQSSARVQLGLALVPTPGYPFALESTITSELTAAGLGVSLTTTNVGPVDAPYGVGFHPWLSPGAGSLDDCVLTLPAGTWIPTDERLLPIGERPVPEAMDFRQPRVLGTSVLDDAFVDVTYVDGRSQLLLKGTDGRTAVAWMDQTLIAWQVCTGDALASAQRRSGFAAEPMTCIADAFRTGDHLLRLGPGEQHSVTWGLTLQ